MKCLAFSLILFMISVSVSAQTLADTLLIDGSAVVAQKVLVKMDEDKVVYKIEDDVDAKTSTVLDMLRKVPMVSVDAQDNITVNGSSGFQVYVDGKPNPMLSANPSQILKMMPATAVKHVEVVTSPGAKYDAEGVGGVLNLITSAPQGQNQGKRSLDGQYGTVSLQGSTRGYGGGVYYSMQKDKFAFNFSGNASDTYVKGAESIIERTLKLESGDFITKTEGIADIQTPFYNGSVNLSYEIDSLNLITIGAGYVGTRLNSDSDFQTDIYNGNVLSRTITNSISANMDYQHIWVRVPQRSLVVSYQFSANPTITDVSNTFQQSYMPDRRAEGFMNSMSHTVQTDFSTPLSAGHMINAGAKFLARHNSSSQTRYVSREALQDGKADYDFYNNIGALYAEYDGTVGLVGVKAGARYEHTWQNIIFAQGIGKSFGLNYGNLVPNASMQYNISQIQNLGLAYNMRISRPGITYLNPFIDDFSDPTAKSYGNPDLTVEIGHNLSLTYNYFSPSWILCATLRQSMVRNGIAAYIFYDDENIMNTTYGNIISSSSTGLNSYVMWIPGQKSRIILNGSVGYTDIRSKELDCRNGGWTYTALLGVQQTLPWDLRLSANIISSGRTVTLQGWSSGMFVGTLGLTRTFFDDKLSLSLSALSHLATGRGFKVESFSEDKGFISHTTTSIPIRMISFNLSFSFGRQDKVDVKKSRTSIEQDGQLNIKSMTESIGTVIQM